MSRVSQHLHVSHFFSAHMTGIPCYRCREQCDQLILNRTTEIHGVRSGLHQTDPKKKKAKKLFLLEITHTGCGSERVCWTQHKHNCGWRVCHTPCTLSTGCCSLQCADTAFPVVRTSMLHPVFDGNSKIYLHTLCTVWRLDTTSVFVELIMKSCL